MFLRQIHYKDFNVYLLANVRYIELYNLIVTYFFKSSITLTNIQMYLLIQSANDTNIPKTVIYSFYGPLT